jgi:hypothetical protein
MMNIGDRVKDANVVRLYGADNAKIGTVTRIYESPFGMVEVLWDGDDWEDAGAEDAWTDELETVWRYGR